MPSPPTKDMGIEMDKIGGNDSELLMDVADDESDDRANAPAKKQASTIQPAPTQTEAGPILPASMEIESWTTSEQHVNHMQWGTPLPDRSTPPCCTISIPDNASAYDE